MRKSKAERDFCREYPNARVEIKESGICGMPRYVIYAGNYRCAESLNKVTAFRHALHQARLGNITPDPNEFPTVGGIQ